MLRIDSTEIDGVLVIRMEGRLLAPWVHELRQLIEAHYGCGRLRLDLSALNYADPDGVDVLEAARRNGTEIFGATPFVAELLATASR